MSSVNWTYLLFYAGTIGMSAFYHGYFMTSFNVALQYYSRIYGWNKNPNSWFTQSVIAALLPIGAIIGAFSSKFVATLGRRKMMLIINMVLCISVLISFIKSTYTLGVMRFLGGYCVGSFTFLVPLYLREISPKENGGAIGSFYLIFSKIGQLSGALVGLGVPQSEEIDEHNYFQIISGILFAISFFQSLIFCFIFTHESPRYYAIIMDRENCKAALSKIYSDQSRTLAECNEYCLYADETINGQTSMLEIFGPKHFKALIVGSMIHISHIFSGFFSLIIFSTTLYISTGVISETTAIRYLILFTSSGLVATLIFVFLIDSLGRKCLMVGGFAGLVKVSLILAFASMKMSTTIIAIGSCVFVFVYSLTVGPQGWIHCAEILPTAGVTLTTVAFWLGDFILASGFLRYQSIVGLTGFFFTVTVTNLIAAIAFAIMMKETKGNTDLQNMELYCDTYKRPNRETSKDYSNLSQDKIS